MREAGEVANNAPQFERKPVDLPKINRRPDGTLWDRLVDADFQAVMQADPERTYPLLDEKGAVMFLTEKSANTLARHAPRPYRVQMRTFNSKKDQRLIYVSYAPKHWALKDTLRRRRLNK